MQKIARKEQLPIKMFNLKSPKVKYQEYLKRGRIKWM